MIGTNNFGFILKQIGKNKVEISMFVNNENLMSYKYNGNSKISTWDFSFIVEFFRDNLKFILTEDNYPINVNKDVIGIEFLKNTNKYVNGLIDWSKIDADDELEFEKLEKLSEIKDNWVYKHSWNYYNTGAYIPDVVFRKIGQNIEVSWDNSDNEKIKFNSIKGTYLIPINGFERIIRDFIINYNKISC